jgi:hypothetical protein
LLTPAQASGFAVHPQRMDYDVLVHVVHQKNILCSVIADRPPPSSRDKQSNCWFNVELASFGLSYLDLNALTFLIGETDELLDVVRVRRRPKPSPSAPLLVEDLMLANVRRAWITGATYLEAAEAGVSDANIIELMYIDLLGRRADPDGLANYLFHRREGTRSLADVRRELVQSQEYAERRKEVAWAPGAIFSQPIVLRSTAAAIEADAAPTPRGAPTPAEPPNKPLTAVPSKVITRLSPRLVTTAPRKPEAAEIALRVDSAMLGPGWYEVEYLDDAPFRWMAAEAAIFNPQPELPCTSIVLSIAGVYGAHVPMLDCYFDEVAAEVRVEAQGTGFIVTLSPPDSKPQKYTCLRIASRASGCPAAEKRGTDRRVLSLNLQGGHIAYAINALMSSVSQG